jgi:hypothetical protein
MWSNFNILKTIIILFSLFVIISCSEKKNKIIIDNSEKIIIDTNANNIKMKKILKGNFTFRMLYCPSFETPFEIIINKKDDEHVLSICPIYFLDKIMIENIGKRFIPFNRGTFVISENKFQKFIEILRKLDYSDFSIEEIIQVDGTSTCNFFENGNGDYFAFRFSGCSDSRVIRNFTNTLFNMILSTVKSEPYLTLALKAASDFGISNNIQLINTDPYHIIAFNKLNMHQAIILDSIIRVIPVTEPILLDFHVNANTTSDFYHKLQNIELKRKNIYYLVEKSNIIIDNPTHTFFNLDSVYSKIVNQEKVYAKYFYEYRRLEGEPVPIPDSVKF